MMVVVVGSARGPNTKKKFEVTKGKKIKKKLNPCEEEKREKIRSFWCWFRNGKQTKLRDAAKLVSLFRVLFFFFAIKI